MHRTWTTQDEILFVASQQSGQQTMYVVDDLTNLHRTHPVYPDLRSHP